MLRSDVRKLILRDASLQISSRLLIAYPRRTPNWKPGYSCPRGGFLTLEVPYDLTRVSSVIAITNPAPTGEHVVTAQSRGLGP